MNMNPEAVNLDPRWPLDSVDIVYCIKEDGLWHLRDFFGKTMTIHEDINACKWLANNLRLTTCERQ